MIFTILKIEGMRFFRENIYHVYNRGNNSNPIFFERENYYFFLKKMRRHLLPYCDILAWCLMPNHFHWLIYVNGVNETEPKEQIQQEKPVADFNKGIGVYVLTQER